MFINPLYEKLRSQKILEAARTIFFRNKTEKMFVFYLNRQAAFVNKLHLCEPQGESPLGPITIIIRSKRIDDFINWLAPPTKNGKPISLDMEPQSLEDL